MPTTRWNKGKVPVNADAYSLTSDLATEADTLNVVVPVASQTERDGLTPPSPGKYAGMVVSRTDLPGAALQTYDGTNWATQQVPKVWATTARAGSASGLLAGLQGGSFIPIFQTGTAIATTDSIGNMTVTFPQAFPNGVLAVIPVNGDNTAFTGAAAYYFTLGGVTLTTFTANMNANGTSAVTRTVRIDYIAIGW